jgi:hypothetical protein
VIPYSDADIGERGHYGPGGGHSIAYFKITCWIGKDFIDPNVGTSCAHSTTKIRKSCHYTSILQNLH